jgi:predicted nuclease of restriction endonuclease-like (RecB) superfamily
MNTELNFYTDLLADIKNRIRQGQLKANLAANAELLGTYWDIGKMIHERQQQEGWGKGVVPRLAVALKNELAEERGFSERNLKFMVQFYHEYQQVEIGKSAISQLENTANTKRPVSQLNPSITKSTISQFETPSILPPSVAKLEDEAIGKLPISQLETEIGQPAVARLTSDNLKSIFAISWTHHIALIQKIKDLPTRFWYMQETIRNGWSRDALVDMIKSNLHLRQGKVVHNFEQTLPAPHSELAKQLFKDPYIFDFLTLSAPFTERELELELLKNVEKFLLELGAGFAFVGRQYKLEVSGKEFFIDLLFYHLKMRSYVVIDLKKGEFLPEYAGKMNFYCSAVDDILRHPDDKPTIGLILCQEKDKLFAEYALRDMHKPIGISDYELTRTLPESFKGSLPTIEQIEQELTFKD